MTVEQLQLAPVHQHDGPESRAAAAKVNAANQYRKVLETLYGAEKPLTDDELGHRAGLLRHSAGTRRGVAVKRGHVVRAGDGVSDMGNRAATWTLTEDGRDFVDRLRGAHRAA